MARRGDIDDLTLEQGDGADASVVPASVMKVLVALTAMVQLESGQLDATARVRRPVVPRTPGPVGFSLYADEIELSVRDLLVPVLTLSDNAATDVLIDLVGGMPDRVWVHASLSSRSQERRTHGCGAQRDRRRDGSIGEVVCRGHLRASHEQLSELGSAIDTLIGQVAREAFEELLGG